MRLRTLAKTTRFAGQVPGGRRLLTALALASVMLVGSAGSSGAGVAEYGGTVANTPLYLAGPASTVAGSSYQIVPTAGPTGLATPVASNGGAGALTGSYNYIYTVTSGGATTASAVSNQLSITSPASAISVANVPVGAALYRQKGGVGNFLLVTASTNASPYLDNTPDASVGPTVLPQSDTRVALGVGACTATTCGYADFTPGAALALSSTNSPVVAAPSLPAACKGWVVDGSGSVSFASGVWTFGAKVKSAPVTAGTARLAVGMFKVDGSGAPVGGWLLDPGSTENGAVNLLNNTGATTAVSVTATAPTFSLGSSEHVCVQFYRHQTAPGTGARTLSLLAWDSSNAITAHPAPNRFANTPTPSSPAAGATVAVTPQLQADYSDPDGDAGTVTFELCSASSCGTVLQTSSVAATSGGTASWTPTALADGTYWWQAHAKDATGPASASSAARSFTVTTTPSVAPGASPANGATVNAVTLGGTFTDPNAADNGNVEFQVCPDSLCVGVTTSGSVAVTNGGTATWTPSLSDGLYHWRLRAVDAAGNASAWTATRSFTLDSTPPVASIGSGPTNPSGTTNATFTFSSNEGGSTFECSLNGGAFASCTSPKTYSGLAEGSRSFDVRAIDSVGNVGTATGRTWTVDTTAPDTTIGPGKPADPTNATTADVDFSSTESGSTFACKLDTGSYAPCTSPKSYSGLGAGTHTVLVRATDAAGNTDATPASYTWSVDLTAPNTMLAPADPTSPTTATSADFDFSATEAGSTFECSLDSAAFAACSSPAGYSGLGDGPHTFRVRAVDAAGNADATPGSFTWTVDNAAPDTTLGSTHPADPTNAVSASFDFSSSESGSTFECSLDGGAFAACTSPKTYTAQPDGARTFSVRAVDAAGNRDASPASYTWTIDTAPPDTTLGATHPPALLASGTATFTFSSSEAGSTFRCSLDGGAYTTCTSPATYNGLHDGSHTFGVEAVDVAGNVDGTPASYTWITDTAAPQTTLGSGSPAPVSTSAAASFTFTSSESGGSFECSVDGGAYGACTSPRALSGLAEGPHSFSVRAIDAAGNGDQTPASYSWSVDTLAPATPVAVAPANEAWQTSLKVSATFEDPAFAGSGSLDFRLCSDALCAGVAKSWSSAIGVNGRTVDWTSSSAGEGHWFWQARATDAAGNHSAWSGARAVNLDRTAPTAPPHFNGVVAGDGLTLRWEPVADAVANYVVFVDGKPFVNLGSTEYELKLGAFDAGDPRRFSVVAVDLAGNVGAASPVLVGVPNLVGLTPTAAADALATRGFHLRQAAALVHTGAATVVAQDPNAATLAPEGSAVQVVVSEGSDAETPFTLSVGPLRTRCVAGAVLKLRLRLSQGATVTWRVRGLAHASGRLGSVPAGSSQVRIRLPKSLRAGHAYLVELHATAGKRQASTTVRVAAARAARLCGAR